MGWLAVVVTAVGASVTTIGIVGMQSWDVMIVGFVGVIIGSALFAVATIRTAAPSRGAAPLLGVASILMIPTGLAGHSLGAAPLCVATVGFAVGWFILGIDAIRLDRPAAEARPA